MIKNVKVFFNYLNKEQSLGIGDFHKLFYVRKENISIQTLLPEELNFLISNKEFEASLNSKLRRAKDVFVIGCTVALRVSDLIALKSSNLQIVNGQYYLAVRSVKTSTDTLIKLPSYAIQIIMKYQKKNRKTLLPYFAKCNLNKIIKKLMELAGFTNIVSKKREKRGKVVELFWHKEGQSKHYRFCDLASTHLMRRTAITTMLSLGMPELIVRKISGHNPGGKDFYRYINWAQSHQDQESDRMFARLQEKHFQNMFQNA
jgi:integrase